MQFVVNRRRLYLIVLIHFQLIAKIAVVKLEGPPYLCKSDEVGELCISSGATGSAYWGLAGKTNQTFKVIAIFEVTVNIRG